MDDNTLAGNIASAKNPKDFKITGEPLGIEPVTEGVEDFRKYMAAYITESADLLKGVEFYTITETRVA